MEVKEGPKNNNNNNHDNISTSEEEEEEEKQKEDNKSVMDECESSPLRSPLHSLHDDDKPFSPLPPPFQKPFSPTIGKPFSPRPLQKPFTPPVEKPVSPTLEKPFSPPPPPPSAPQLHPQPKRQPPPLNPQSTAMVKVDRRSNAFSPVRSPPLEKIQLPVQPPPPPPPERVSMKPQSPVFVVNRSIREELSAVTKMDGDGDGLNGGERRGGDVEDGGSNRKPRVLSAVLSRQRKEDMVKRAALGFRVCAVIFCLVSFSVMAADKTQGWAGDSFDRYKEYRYCISVTIIGFVYSGFQAFDLAYNLVTEKHVIPYYIRHYFDFSMDQILTYLLISASSSAATRVDDWQTNWGKDEFTVMASASVGMSFMAFVAFAVSSLISGYNLCTRNYNN